MEIIISGSDNNIKKFLKLNSLFMKRNGLILSKDAKAKDAKAKDVIALIESVETLEDLKQFESDNRTTVKTVYDKKLQELSQD